MKLGVALGWHAFAWEDLLDLVQRAEALGFAAAYVDGDASMLGVQEEIDVLDGWTVTTALIHRTQRIHVGSIRLVQHWNAAHLAQCAATLERVAPGRLRFFASIGERPEDPRFGYPRLSTAARIRWLDETLGAVRGLWRGESVSVSGEFVQLDAARVRPVLGEERLPIEIGARGDRLLGVVARHADIWNINLPPIPERVARADDVLRSACAACGRDPNRIQRSLWIFARVQTIAKPAAVLEEFRRLSPWFREIPDAEVERAIVAGDAEHCRSRLAELADTLRLEHPVIDLSGMESAEARETLEALAPGGKFD